VRTCLIDALIAAVLKVGGFIGLAAAEDWNEGNVLEASGVLDKMIPIRRKTGIRAKGDPDPIYTHPFERVQSLDKMSVTA
jgi:hypothetical protein